MTNWPVWKSHIEHLSRKCAQATGRLWRHGRCLTIRARKTWYISMILSPLMFASNSFSPSLSQTLLSRVEKVAKSGIWAIFRVKRHTASAPLRHRLNVKPIAQLYREKSLLFVFRCLEGLSSPLFSTSFYYLHKSYRAWHQPRPVDQAVASSLPPWSVWAEINSICRCNSAVEII